METGFIHPEKPRVVIFLIICLLLVYGAFVLREYEAYTFALYDPGWMVSTVMSIVEDRDLDLRNQLKNDPSQAADQTSMGKNGQWYPLHEFLMPVVTVPFYLAFGIDGCLVFNVVISILLMVLLFWLCSRHVDYQSAFTATVLTAFPSLFLNYSYSYSLDVFSAFLLVLSYFCAVKRKFVLTGFVWGLATYARLANAITILGFITYFFLTASTNDGGQRSDGGFRIRLRQSYAALKYLAGGLPMGICFLVTNWLMFGSPITTSYDRWQHFVDGQAVVTSQSAAFSCSLIENLPKVFFDQKAGLVLGAPLVILAVAFGMRTFSHKARNESILMAMTCILLIALFSKYCNAVAGTPGNRYLMPVAALCAIPLAFAVANCFQKGKS